MTNHELEEDHLARVSALVRDLEREGLGFEEICRLARGAFPGAVARFCTSAPASRPAVDHVEAPSIDPQESPGSSEWFFTTKTSERISGHAEGSTLLLGAPSVAKFVERGLLVDSSPWVAERFTLGSTRVLSTEVERAELSQKFNSAVLDPPWYQQALSTWLKLASKWVSADGLIILPLFGDLTRPGAEYERADILDLAERLGSFELLPGAVVYRTPRFEAMALEAAGLPAFDSWRTSDLLVIRNQRPQLHFVAPPLRSEWIDYRIGNRIVCVRHGRLVGGNQRGPAIVPVAEDGNWRISTVSRRSKELQAATIWTSENTAGVVQDWPRVSAWISELQNVPPGSRTSGAEYFNHEFVGGLA